MSRKNILKEAIADSKSLKAAAIANAQALLLESMKEDLAEMVEDQMNEMAGDELAEEAECAESDEVKKEGNEMGITEADLELELGEDEDEDKEEGEDGAEDEDGLSEADLHEALAAALLEVDHGDLGEPEEVSPEKHDTGLLDVDKKEEGWAEKEAPAAKDMTVKEHKARIAKLVAENTMLRKENGSLRKANDTLKKTVSEVQLFNSKLHYAHKLLQMEGLNDKAKRLIVAKIDSAKSVNETKIMFETLQVALGAVGEKKAPKKSNSLSEALGVHGNGSGKNVSEAVVPQTDIGVNVARMKELAGIK